MIIPNRLIKLDYDPTKDILFVEWPYLEYYSLTEISRVLDDVVDTVRHYDVNYLMIDARTTVTGVKEEDYNRVASKFAKDLMTTRLKKAARLLTGHLDREKQVLDIHEKSNLELEFKSFETVDEALEWFQSN